MPSQTLPRDSKPSSLSRYEESIGAALIKAKDAVIAPMRHKLRCHGITEPQWRVMRVLYDRGTENGAGLAGICNLHQPSVSRILRQLVSREYVLRNADPRDQRHTTVALSACGQEIVNSCSLEMAQILQSYADQFGAIRLERLVTELEALSVVIENMIEFQRFDTRIQY